MDMNKYKTTIRNASLVERKTLQVHANTCYGVTTTPAPSPAPAPAPAAKKTTLVAAGDKGILTCNAKGCPEVVAKEQCEKYAGISACAPPVCINCWKVKQGSY